MPNTDGSLSDTAFSLSFAVQGYCARTQCKDTVDTVDTVQGYSARILCIVTRCHTGQSIDLDIGSYCSGVYRRVIIERAATACELNKPLTLR